MAKDNKVHVKFFAIFREYIGVREEWTEIDPGMTVEQLWLRYAEHARNPRVANIRSAYSVNQRLAKADTVLHGGEEVGFLPPVSGGAGKTPRKNSSKKRPASKTRRAAKRAPRPRVSKDYTVTAKKLSLADLIARVEDPGAGAIVTFTGVVRDHAHDRAVKYLEYEAYPELAEKTLAEIGQEACTRWNGVKLAMAHRTGHMGIGTASVMIAASAPHRAEAFAACRYAIERIKAVLPVWKKEFATNDEYWVEGPLAGEMTPAQAEEVVRHAEPGQGELAPGA